MKKIGKFTTREEWLQAAVKFIEPLFKGKKFPPVRVATGWPSRKAVSAKSRAIGQCWSPECSADNITEIFISPYLDKVDDKDQGVLETLVHELVHAVVGVEHGHKKPFRAVALAVGLEGKMTSTSAGTELHEILKEIAKDLGPYPHARLDARKGPGKSQSTRMLKCTCGECGFTVRMTRKWVDEVGAAHCPVHGAMVLDIAA